MQSSNTIIIASAGSGKTTAVVDDACADDARKSAVVTYTNNGKEEIVKATYERFGHVPPHVSISTWYTFLLRHFVRPYQRALYAQRVNAIHFVNQRSALKIPEANTRAHFFSQPDRIYLDKVAKFALRVIKKTGGLPIDRFVQIFDRLLIDESQDLAGYDLDLIEGLLSSGVEVTLCGDHRQATYSTHSAARNSQYGGAKIVRKFEAWQKDGLCTVEYQNRSRRCVQAVCDLADRLYPDAPPTASENADTTGHDGVFIVRPQEVPAYMSAFKPQTLRFDRKTHNVPGRPLNFGTAKGMTFDRVLIFPHGKLKKFLVTGDAAQAGTGTGLAKTYVALTRARQSVAIVLGGKVAVPGIEVFRP